MPRFSSRMLHLASRHSSNKSDCNKSNRSSLLSKRLISVRQQSTTYKHRDWG
ncbi:hypothetical protein D3C76_1550520 [compost metagenome]